MRQLLIAGGILCVLAAAPLRAQESVDLLLHNGKIFTADELLSTFTAVAVRDDRIVALGWDGLLDQYRAVRTVDLDDKLVVPGFIDTHIHISGDPERWVDLAGLENMAELKARVTRKAEQLGSGEWITGYGWSEDELAERRRQVHAALLDLVGPDHRIIQGEAAQPIVIAGIDLQHHFLQRHHVPIPTGSLQG